MEGVPVWSHAGMICTGETYKKVVKMTFAKGASLDDPRPLQLQPRRQHQARHRHPRGRVDRREGIEGAHPRRRGAEHVLAEPDPRVQPAQRSRRPPVPVAEQRHQRRHEQRADTIVASISTASAVPTPSSLMKTICEVAKAPIATQNSSAAAVTMRPVRSSPSATASRVGRAAVVRLLDAREQEDAVVGGEPEGDREQQDRLGRLEARRCSGSRAGPEVAVLEDQHEQPERRAEREHVHQQRLDRQHDRAGHQEQDDQLVTARMASASGRCPSDRRPLVEEPGGRPPTGHREGRRPCTGRLTSALVALVRRSRGGAFRSPTAAVERQAGCAWRARRRRQPASVAATATRARCRPSAATRADQDRDRLEVSAAKSCLSASSTWRGSGRAGRLRVDGREPDAQRRAGERTAARAVTGRRARPAHHAVREPYQGPALARRRARAARCSRAGRAR